MSRKPILCLNFDGVLHSYTSGWKGAEVVPDGPVPGAVAFLAAAVQRFEVHVYSSRSETEAGRSAMRDALMSWFPKEGFAASYSSGGPLAIHTPIAGVSPPDQSRWIHHGNIHFPTSKPPALVTLDDRALTFTGKWPSLDDLAAFQPWMKREAPALAAAAPSELEQLREEVAYWRRDLEARLWSLTARYRALRTEGRLDAAVVLGLELRSALASYDDAKGGEWHERCDACGEFVLPGEPRAGDDEISGHARCLGDVRDEAPAEPDPADNLDARAEAARAALNEAFPAEAPR